MSNGARYRTAIRALVMAVAICSMTASASPKPTPPDVVAILSKLGGNRPLTPAELTKLTTFYHGASTVSSGGLEVSSPDNEEDAPITFEPNPFVQLATVKAPSQDEYVALAREVKALFGALLPAEGRRQLDAILSKATRAGYGADLGLLLLVQQAAPAAVYTTATEALKNPTDGLTANNLGVALKGLHEYPRALRALLYARAVAPSLDLSVTNLGYVQALMGDTTTGERTLREAVGRDPNDACAAEGLGLLELARGDVRGALHRLMGMMGKGYLPGGASAVEAGQQLIMDAQSEQEDGGGKSGGGGAPSEPVTHPSTPAQAGPPPSFDTPPDITTGMNLYANWKAFGQWVQQPSKELDKVTAEFASVALRGGIARARQEAQPGFLARTNERERFALTALGQRLSKQEDELLQQSRLDELFEAASRKDDAQREDIANQRANDQEKCAPLNGEALSECMRRADDRECDAKDEMINSSYAQVYQAWKTYYEQLHRAIWEYHHFCAPWLQDIHDRDLNKELNLERQVQILSMEARARGTLMTHLVPGHRVWYCEKKPGIPPKQGVLKMWPNDDPTDCRGPQLRLGLGPVSLTGDCDKLKFEGGEGLVTALTYKIGGPEALADDELTVFVGVGAKAAAGPADIKVKLGPYITIGFDESGYPTVKDYGLRSELGGEVALGAVSAGAKVDARLGAESGVGVDFKPGVKVGVKVKP
jgi:hypothetical protein